MKINIILVIKMRIPLIPDKYDPIWNLFGKVIKVIDSRTFQEELARNGFKNIKNHQNLIKILLLSMYFKLNVTDVYFQLITNLQLSEFLNIKDLQSLKQVRELYTRYSEGKYLELALKTINKLQFSKIRNINTIVFDSTSITLDLKFDGRYLSKQMLLDKDYKRCFSTNIGHYAGFKMTLAIEQRTCKPLAILMHQGCPNDAKIFDDMLAELKRRRILRTGQLILADRGFYSLKNYLIGINKYKIVPLLFPKKKPSLITLIMRLQEPLDSFKEGKYKKGIYYYLKEKLINLLPKWEDFRRDRWKIEKVFDFLKNELKLKDIHGYTKRSVYKHVYLNVLLMGILISKGYNEIEEIIKLVDFT
jgi:hypothetical protein